MSARRIASSPRILGVGGRMKFSGEPLAPVAAMLLLVLWMAGPLVVTQSAAPNDVAERPVASETARQPRAGLRDREVLVAGYISQPFYYRSDVDLKRPDGTDLKLKRLGWDGDALMPPIDGGVRSMEWWGPFGLMVDFLHNKAVARLGKGAHGRKIKNPVIEDVDLEGTWKGQPAPTRAKLTDIFSRLEFTHGHNILILTPMLQFAGLSPSIRPYVGAGVGVAFPHVEVWFPDYEQKTSEYQYAGAAWQVVAGVEFRRGNWSWLVEYKFNFAWISGAITGAESWMNWFLPGDFWNQFQRWRKGEEPKHGSFKTRLGAHQIAVGAGYWFDWSKRKAP